MKYVIATEYQVSKLLDSVKEAEDLIQEYYDKGGKESRFICGVIKGYEVKVPIHIIVKESDDISKLVADNNRLLELEQETE